MTDDADRLELLDRLEDRLPELDLDANEIAWMTLEDGHEALLVNGGGIEDGDGACFANAGEDASAWSIRPSASSASILPTRTVAQQPCLLSEPPPP